MMLKAYNQIIEIWDRVRKFVILIVLWEILGKFELVSSGALPALSEIFIRLWQDKSEYPEHILATLQGAGYGFLIGNILAILAGVLFILFPWTHKISRGLNITLFALPPIAIAPILSLTLSGIAPRVVLAALGCYFVSMTATVVGLSQSDQGTEELIRAYGGKKFKILRFVSWRRALPAILSGLRVAAPNAVLGAILAEFGSGGRWGLGSYLLGSLGRGEPERLWGIGLVATGISGLTYYLFYAISTNFSATSRFLNIGNALPQEDKIHEKRFSTKILIGSISFLLPFLVWYSFIQILEVPQMIGKTPLAVIEYLFFHSNSEISQAKLLAALFETLPITLVGMFAGLLTAFCLAIGTRLFPELIKTLMPIALISQTMPLVALTPLLVLLLGRGVNVILWITISVTFFPAFVTMVQGIQMVPKTTIDVPRAYAASPWTEMRFVIIPASMPYLFAATRLTAPRALLGVMIAEWLATGTGLGNLMNQSRGYIDFGMIWTIAAVSVIISVLFYQTVVVLERQVLGRLGMVTVE
jgi:ABC-type nitrate/sulfonate/bicarbonate transport system permease component